jgi:hypothetical protein
MEFSVCPSSSPSSTIPSVPSRWIVSIYGTIQIPIDSVSSGSSVTIPIQSNHYSFSMDLIEKYRNILHPIATTGTESLTSLPNQMKIVFDSNLPQFDHRFIAVHPLTHRVIVSSKSFPVSDNNNNNNNNKAGDSTNNNPLLSIFQLGILRFQKLLNNNPSSFQVFKLSSRDHFKTILFPQSSKELPGHQLQPAPRSTELMLLSHHYYSFIIYLFTRSKMTLPSSNKEQLVGAIRYCNLIDKEIVTDQAILFACIDSLESRGAMPVGEVGKAISFQSDSVLITKHLKDQHDGLKKFLERFPAVFVFGSDHTYNPHVYLIEKLFPEHLLMMKDNLLPIPIILQYRKVISMLQSLRYLFKPAAFFLYQSKPSRKASKQLAILSAKENN